MRTSLSLPGRLLRRPPRDHPAATVADFLTGVLRSGCRSSLRERRVAYARASPFACGGCVPYSQPPAPGRGRAPGTLVPQVGGLPASARPVRNLLDRRVARYTLFRMNGYQFIQRHSRSTETDNAIFAIAESSEAAKSIVVAGYGISGARLIGYGPEILKAARAAGCKDNDIIIN